MSRLSRRQFLRNAAATSLAFSSLGSIAGCSDGDDPLDGFTGFGPLLPDPNGIIDLPEGFSYEVISQMGDVMDDGLLVPAALDGMAAFAAPDGQTILIRNQELFAFNPSNGPFGDGNEMFGNVDAARVYDAGEGMPQLGGTTTLVYDTQAGRLTSQFLSLVGTVRNCAGGATPWGTWISCEEFTGRVSAGLERDHGYNFEVPARTTPELTPAVPLIDMGRFNHEAVAVDPETGIIYETEDRQDSCFYRFLPNEDENPAAGGRLQALVVLDQPTLDTRNWTDQAVPLRVPLAVGWVDLEEPASPNDDLRNQAQSKGAAIFARGEGMWTGDDGIYFTCTSGGRSPAGPNNGAGQIFRYVPGDSGEGTLELLVQPDDPSLLNMADNMTIAPWGDLVICEDGFGQPNRLVVFRPDGQHYLLASNAFDESELAGATFSPDGSTLFVNFQFSGFTFAIRGPWPV